MGNMMRYNWKNTLLRVLLAAMMSVGILCFVLPLACSALAWAGCEVATSEVELPIEYIGSLRVDTKGRIYIYSITYERLQMYNNSGDFIRGWFTPGKEIVSINNDDGTVQLVGYDDENYKYDL